MYVIAEDGGGRRCHQRADIRNIAVLQVYGKMAAHTDEIHELFPPDLCIRINDAVHQYPDLQPLFHDIARHVKSSTSNPALQANGNNKKRKLDDDSAPAAPLFSPEANGTAASTAIRKPITAYVCEDVSIQVPARKKLKLHFVRDVEDNRRQEVRLQNPATTVADYTLPADQIDQVFCLPVPEKPKRQWNFVLFPKPGAKTVEGKACEQIVFWMDEVKLKPEHRDGRADGLVVGENDTFVTVTEQALNSLLQPQGKNVVIASEKEFASSIPQPHRKGEKAYHVKAYRGSKDGMLSPSTSCPNTMLTEAIRLPFLPIERHRLRLQETPRLLPLCQHRGHQLHRRAPTHL